MFLVEPLPLKPSKLRSEFPPGQPVLLPAQPSKHRERICTPAIHSDTSTPNLALTGIMQFNQKDPSMCFVILGMHGWNESLNCNLLQLTSGRLA